jgi:hypothetical protein
LTEVLGLQIQKQAQDEPYSNIRAHQLLDFMGVYKTAAVAAFKQDHRKSIELNGLIWGIADKNANKVASALIENIREIQSQLKKLKAHKNNQEKEKLVDQLQDLESKLKQLPLLN